DDLHDARKVAAALDIPHYIVNFERRFDEQVVSNFVREYAAGRTPLPCVHCNSDLKFATLAERASAFGADAVATGHYARVERDAASGRYRLRRGVDPAKDQSYFLFSLTQAQLAAACFPIGDRPKAAVRAYARERGTLTASLVNWIAREPAAPLRVRAQIRHRHEAAPATVRALGDARAEVVFDAPQIAITPGQAVVFYDDDDVVVGGGWID